MSGSAGRTTLPSAAAARPSRLSDALGAAVMIALTTISLALLLLPSLIVVAISFTETAYITFPPRGFTFKWYAQLLERQQLIDAAVTSLRIAGTTTLLCVALAVPAAYSLVRGTYPGKLFAGALIVAPQMIPGMVIGVALLFFGAYIQFRQSDLMLVLGLTVFCLPFAVRLVMAQLALLDPRLEEASLSLGATRLQTFSRITLRQLSGAVLAGSAFVFIESFDNLTVALFTASPRGRPLSVELYNLVQFDSSPLVAALSSLEILLAFAVMLILSRAVGLDRLAK